MAAFDYTPMIVPHLDRHMVLPILQFLQANKLGKEEDLLAATVEFAQGTKMVDFFAAQYKQLKKTDQIPKNMEDLRSEVLKQLVDWKEACTPLLDVLNDTELVNELRHDNNFHIEYLKRHYNATEDNVNQLYRYAKLNFDCGRYRDAAGNQAVWDLSSSHWHRGRFLVLFPKLEP